MRIVTTGAQVQTESRFIQNRGIFWILGICGAVALGGAFLYRDTCKPRKGITVLGSFARIGHALKNRVFTARLFLFSILAMQYSSFLAASSFVYQIQFKLSAQEFSAFFAFNAVFSLLGPIIHITFLSKLAKKKIIFWEILTPTIFGGLIIIFGGVSPWLFALLMIPITFFGAALRAPATVLMMQPLHGDNGVASSLIQCCAMIFGSLSMLLATLGFWPMPSMAIGFIVAIIGAFAFIYWLRLSKTINE